MNISILFIQFSLSSTGYLPRPIPFQHVTSHFFCLPWKTDIELSELMSLKLQIPKNPDKVPFTFALCKFELIYIYQGSKQHILSLWSKPHGKETTPLSVTTLKIHSEKSLSKDRNF